MLQQTGELFSAASDLDSTTPHAHPSTMTFHGV